MTYLQVTQVSAQRVLSSEAYLLFYIRDSSSIQKQKVCLICIYICLFYIRKYIYFDKSYVPCVFDSM